MKLPNLVKLKKTGIGMATMALGLVVTVQTNVNVAAATETHAVVPISAIGLPSDAGLWTGTDGSCTWQYDVISRTLRISGTQKSSQLSSTPFLKQFKWSGKLSILCLKHRFKWLRIRQKSFPVLSIWRILQVSTKLILVK